MAGGSGHDRWTETVYSSAICSAALFHSQTSQNLVFTPLSMYPCSSFVYNLLHANLGGGGGGTNCPPIALIKSNLLRAGKKSLKLLHVNRWGGGGARIRTFKLSTYRAPTSFMQARRASSSCMRISRGCGGGGVRVRTFKLSRYHAHSSPTSFV